jgi:para-nitrobenzyl esterase
MKALSFLLGVGLLILVLVPLQAQVAAPLQPIATKSGQIAGMLLPSGVKAWHGIRYAQAPTGARRWAPPQATSWNGIWNADRFGPECIQPLRNHTQNQYFGEVPTSEDCLFLNIWAAPKSTPASKLPVLVFVHGGGTTVGAGSLLHYSGENFARRGAVMVTINYRLRQLGWMAHPELTKEQGGRSGNYTLQDMAAALKWVQDNIEQFGGDPARVTLMGQSWGATAVFELLMSPRAKGLFQRAVLDSACPAPAAPVHIFCGFRQNSLAEAEKNGLALQAALEAPNLAAMRDLPADRILAQPPRGTQTVDGWFIPRTAQETMRDGLINDVPILWTANSEDVDWTRNPFANIRTAAQYTEAAAKAYGDKAGEFLKHYPMGNDAFAAARRVVIDMSLQQDQRQCAAVFRRIGAKANHFLALYQHKEPIAPGVTYDVGDYPGMTSANVDLVRNGAIHNFDTAYWFGAFDAFNTLGTKRDFTPQDRAMSAQMSDMLIAFGRSGNPSTAQVKLPAWTPGNEQRVVIDHDIHVEPLPVTAMDWLAANPVAGHGPACVTAAK